MDSTIDITQSALGTEETDISSRELHVYRPYTNSFNPNDEIRIAIQNTDLWTLPYDSFLYLEGKAVKVDAPTDRTPARFVNNGFSHLFSDIRYEMNNIIVDNTRVPGIATTLKFLPSHSKADRENFRFAGWSADWNEDTELNWLIGTDGSFTAWIPLKLLLGFAEDHRKIVFGVKQDLVLIRSSQDNDALYNATDVASRVDLSKVEWHVPHVTLSPGAEARLTAVIKKGASLPIDFMKWELMENVNLPTSTSMDWQVKSTTSAESPMYVIVAFQTGRRNSITKNVSQFDHIKVREIKVLLNGREFPFGKNLVDFTKNEYARIYQDFRDFQKEYYHTEAECAITYEGFKERYPLFVFNCRHRDEVLLTPTVDISVHIETHSAIPADTIAYCLLLYKRQYHYVPIKGIVERS